MSQTTQHNYPSADQVLMGGGGGPTWKFDTEGVRKTGTIASAPEVRQEREYDPNNPGGGESKTFPSGDPIMGIVVEVQTDERDNADDDGRRTFYIEGKRLKDATRSGVRAAGAAGLEVGGGLDVTLTHYDTPGDRRSGRNWKIVYTPAASTVLMGTEPAPAPAPAATPAAPPAPAAPVAAPTPAPAAQPAPADDPAEKAKQLIQLGLDDTTIASATGLDPSVVTAIRTVAA